MSTDLMVREVGLVTIQELEESFAIAVRQRELLANYIKERLTPGKHFYKVQGSKNSLTKEGAELICLPHGYRPRYIKEGGPDQPLADNAPYQITVRCSLMKGDSFAGEGLGSASSYHTTRVGDYKPRQNDPGLCHNATLKMAQKSAYIAATLNATAASEFFTQDVEDEDNAPQQQASSSPALMCPIHKVEWFKRGKMKGYAHTIGDTSTWCNMEDVKKEMERDSRDFFTGGTIPIRADEDGVIQDEFPEIIGNLKDFYAWAKDTYGYADRDALCKDLGIERPSQILTMHTTWDAAAAYLDAQHTNPVVGVSVEGDKTPF